MPLVCALSGCWEEVYYDESKAGTGQPETVAAPFDESGTKTSPAERSDALSEMALDEADRGSPSPVAVGNEQDQSAGGVAAPPATEPTGPPAESLSAEPVEGPSIVGGDTTPPREPAPVQPSATVDELFGPPATSAGPSSGATGYASESPPALAEPVAPEAKSASPDDRRPSTRRMAWLLGSKWSLAALARDRGAPHEEVEKWFSQSRTLARGLGATLPDLPEAAMPDDSRLTPGDATLDYLFEQGRQVGRDLAARYGPDHAALLEMAVKSNILLVLYQPGTTATDSISSAIAQAGSRAGLPAELYEPLQSTLADQAPPAEVYQAVFRLHDSVDRYLTTPAR